MLELDVGVAEAGEQLAYLRLLFGREPARAVVVAVVGAVAAEHRAQPRAEHRRVADPHVVEQPAESPCRPYLAHLLEVAALAAVGGCREHGAAAGARCVECESGLVAYARVAQLAAGVETIEP